MEQENPAVPSDFARNHRTEVFRIADGVVEIGSPSELTGSERAQLIAHLRSLAPWRKGPFRFFGELVEANWRSDLRWNRVAAYLGDVRNLRIADIGCNNGYYLYRLLAGEPAELIGFEPAESFQRQFSLLHNFFPDPRVVFVNRGYEELAAYRESFDLILCLGLLYHHTDPIRILRLLHGALRPGGRLIVETLGFEASLSQPLALIPNGRYAGMKGVWQLPNRAALEAWLRRSGFGRIVFRDLHHYDGEQQRTPYADLPTLEEGLVVGDPDTTVEGYPAPVRIHMEASR